MTLEILNLSIETPQKALIKHLSLKIPAKSFTAILGPSGSGKTTLIKIILGLAHDFKISGEISFAQELLQHDQKKLINLNKRRFAYIPQGVKLWPHLNTLQALSLCARWSGLGNQAWLDKIISLAGLSDHLNKKPHELSGGQRQRLALARVLIAKPRLIIFDEPFSALDQVAKADLIKLIRYAKSELDFTSILITHDLKEAHALAQNIMLLYEGQKLWEGRIESLEQAPFPAEWPLLSFY